MFRQIALRIHVALAKQNCKVFGILPTRSFSDDNNDDCVLPGGGLATKCANFKEEAYFKKKTEDWIKKMRVEGNTIKKIGYFNNVDTVNDEMHDSEARHVRYSCFANKHKNSSEEAYFMEEQNQALKLLAKKLETTSENAGNSHEAHTTGATVAPLDARTVDSTATDDDFDENEDDSNKK